MSAESETALFPVAGLPYPPPTLDSSCPVGIVIAGQSQAGKTTLKDFIANVLQELDPTGQRPPSFPLSNGFRSVTAEVLGWWRYQNPGKWMPGGETEAHDMTNSYVEARLRHDETFPARLDHSYRTPRAEWIMRNKAVDAASAYVSENEFIHPQVIAAAARYARVMRENPKSVGFDRVPSALVLDGRNREELAGIVEEAGMALGGLFVLTCSEEDSVRRRSEETEAEILKAITRQELRNKADRTRSALVGPTTMPEDVPGIIPLHKHTRVADVSIPWKWAYVAGRLFAAGVVVAGTWDAGIHISTDNGVGWDRRSEEKVVRPLVHGMVTGVQLLNR